jgi:RNA recognition motif-containing protein
MQNQETLTKRAEEFEDRPLCRVFVNNMPSQYNEKDILALFVRAGSIKHILLHRTQPQSAEPGLAGQSEAACILMYASEAGALKAIELFDSFELDNKDTTGGISKRCLTVHVDECPLHEDMCKYANEMGVGGWNNESLDENANIRHEHFVNNV